MVAVHSEAGIILLLLFCTLVVEMLWLYNIPLCLIDMLFFVFCSA